MRNVIAAIVAVLMVSGVFVTMSEEVQAASATIKISALSEGIQEGDVFSVTVEVTSTATIGEVSQQIKYDTNILKFQTETSGYEEKDGVISITDSDPSEKNQKYILQFKAIAQGNARVWIAGTPKIYSTSGKVLSLSKNILSVNVGAKKEKSANRNLTSLSVKEGTLDRAFKAIETEYSLKVGQDVKSITILAKPENQGARVEITGADKLLVGNNTVTVKVISETNKTKEYIIHVTRGMGTESSASPVPGQPGDGMNNPEASPVPSENPQGDKENGTRIVEKGGALIFNANEEYELLTLGNLRSLPEGYLSVALAIDNHAVDAYQLENGVDKDMFLLYAKHGTEEPSFYQYDRKEGTLQRYVQNAVGDQVVLEGITAEQYNKKVRELGSIIGAAAGLLVLFAMIAYHFYKKSKGYHKEY